MTRSQLIAYARKRQRPSPREIGRKSLIHALLIIASTISIYPVLRIITVSLRPGNRLLTTSLRIIPRDATLANYAQAFVRTDFVLWLWNTILIAGCTATVGLLLATTSAYVFSRWRFKLRKPLLVFLLATQMIPGAMLIVPIYIIAARLGLINNFIGIVLAYSVTSIPFSIWILKGYYDTIPIALEEAAIIDGASRLRVLWQIIVPLSKPALAVTFLFNFLASWKDFLLARVMLQRSSLYTWALGIQSLQGEFRTEWGVFSAVCTMVAVPIVVLFVYSSKYLISGLTLGSVKGD